MLDKTLGTRPIPKIEIIMKKRVALFVIYLVSMILEAEIMASRRSLALSFIAILIFSLAFANLAESTYTRLSGLDEAYCLNDAIFFISLITVQVFTIKFCCFTISFGQLHQFFFIVVIVSNAIFCPIVYHG